MFSTRKDPEKKLKDKGYPTILISVDGSETHPARDIYLGLALFKNYKNKNENRLLDLACEKGIYNALVDRIEANCKIMKSDTIPDLEKTKPELILLSDLDKIGNLYWTVGYAYATRVLLDIGDYFHQKEKQFNEACKRKGGDFSENPYPVEKEKFWNLSARYYLRSKFLMQYDKSNELIKLMYQDADLKGSGFNSFEEANRVVLGHFDKEKCASLDSEEKVYVETAISQNRYI